MVISNSYEDTLRRVSNTLEVENKLFGIQNPQLRIVHLQRSPIVTGPGLSLCVHCQEDVVIVLIHHTIVTHDSHYI